MTIYLRDRVKELTNTVGTGALTLLSAQSGFRSFSSTLSNGDSTYYCIESETQWEVGIGTYNSNTLSRDTVLSSSSGGSLINITAARTFVYITIPAAKMPFIDPYGELNLSLNTLSDVSLTAPASGQALLYNGSIWLNSALPAGYSDEQAQDSVGTILVNSSSIGLSYSDSTPSITATVLSSGISNAMLAGSIAASNLVGTDIATLGTVTVGTLSTGAVIGGVTVTLGSDATGDVYYRNAGGVLTRLGIGSAAQVLTVAGGLPSWAAPSASITTLNTLTGATQTLAVGTSGTDFAISSAASTHTFNLPDASATARGLITTGTQTIAGAKTFSNSVTVNFQGGFTLDNGYGSWKWVSGNNTEISAAYGLNLKSQGVNINQLTYGSGTPSALTITDGAHLSMVASTEATSINLNLSSTKQFATGTIATQRAMRVQAPTYSFVAASTITTASTLSISGPPVAGTNATITNAYALNVEAGYINVEGVGGSAGIRFANTGPYWAPNILAQNQLGIGSQAYIYIYHSNSHYMTFYNGSISTAGSSIGMGSASFGSTDVNLNRDSAGVLNIRNGTNAQTVRVTGTWTSTTAYELLNFKGKASANFEIGPENGSAGGTLRGLTLGCYPAGTATIVGWAQFRPNASTGALEAFYLGPIADSTAVGGNARGQYAVDLQQGRGSANEVASGYGSFVAGLQCRASGSRAVAMGLSSVATGDFSFAANYSSTASGTSSTAFGGSSCAGTGSITVGDITTAAGSQSIGVGYQCFATGHQSQAFGYICSTGGGNYSMAHGINAGSGRYAMYAHSAGQFAANGDAQHVRFVARRKTTDATATTLMLDGSTTRLTITSGNILFADILISGIKSDGSAAACYKRKVAIKNVAGTTALVGTVETIGTDIEDNAGTDVAITADNTNDALQINVTGIAAETWRWVAVVEGLEIAYGT